MNQRPTGVTILAILAFIRGVLLILFGGLGALFGGMFASFSPALGGLAVVWGLVWLVLGAAFIYVGWGFWRLVAATWRFGIFLAAADILVAVLVALFGGGGITSGTIIGVIIDIAIIYYLLTPGVKAAFGISGDLQSELMGSRGAAITGGGGATPTPAEPPAAPPPAEPPAAPPPASTWTGDSAGGSASGGTEDRDQNA